MDRKRRKYTRPVPFKDAKLIVIAAEGACSEVDYFEGIKAYYNDPRIKIEILERYDISKSAPKYVLEQIDEYKDKFKLKAKYNDEYWIVVDFDRWGSKALKNVASKCHQKQCGLCVSSPRFEVWLLFHFKGVNDYSDKALKKLLRNKDGIEKEITKLIKRKYNSSKLRFSDFEKYIDAAINNSDIADVKKRNRWPQKPGTRVYQIIRNIKISQNL